MLSQHHQPPWPPTVSCSTFVAAVRAVDNAALSRKWVEPNVNPVFAVTAAKRNWTGCANVTCLEEPINGTLALVTLQMNPTTYVRLLEFGHEQAPTCTDPNAAIQDFVNGLINAGCAIRACDINDYVAARPGAASGCMAILAV